MPYNLKFSRFNDRSILIEWPEKIDEKLLEDILNFKNSIIEKISKEKIEVINTYNSILIIYNETIDNINDDILNLKAIYKQKNEEKFISSATWEIPVCYDLEFGLDLEDFSKQKKLSIDDIVRLHSSEIYTVYFIGFLPGFLYLGGLHQKLHFERKSTPKLHIKKGAVAIGGQQTGIYPQNSPGGWHIIGSTPIALFDSRQNPPCRIKAGDKLRFKPVNKSEYLNIESQVAKNLFQFNPTDDNA